VFGTGLVRAPLGVEAGVGEQQPLDRAAVEEMLVDDLRHISNVDKAIPDSVGIDHDDGPMLALVEAAKLVRPDLALQTGVLDGVLERALEFRAVFAGAAWPEGVFFPLVGADEKVVLKLRQRGSFPSPARLSCGTQGFLRQYEVDAT
jgi:hypothetical protein